MVGPYDYEEEQIEILEESNAELEESNAILIVAIERLLIRAESLDKSSTHEGIGNCEAIAAARAAIARAEGTDKAEPCLVCGAPVRNGHQEDHEDGCIAVEYAHTCDCGASWNGIGPCATCGRIDQETSA